MSDASDVNGRRGARALIAATATLLLGGCVHFTHDAPPVRGQVFDGSRPQPGVPVSLRVAGETADRATTDADGRFELTPGARWGVFVPIGPQDRMFDWDVLIDARAASHVVYHGTTLGGPLDGYRSDRFLTLTCQLKAPPAGLPACDAPPRDAIPRVE